MTRIAYHQRSDYFEVCSIAIFTNSFEKSEGSLFAWRKFVVVLNCRKWSECFALFGSRTNRFRDMEGYNGYHAFQRGKFRPQNFAPGHNMTPG